MLIRQASAEVVQAIRTESTIFRVSASECPTHELALLTLRFCMPSLPPQPSANALSWHEAHSSRHMRESGSTAVLSPVGSETDAGPEWSKKVQFSSFTSRFLLVLYKRTGPPVPAPVPVLWHRYRLVPTVLLLGRYMYMNSYM